jgi:hypothetical protein
MATSGFPGMVPLVPGMLYVVCHGAVQRSSPPFKLALRLPLLWLRMIWTCLEFCIVSRQHTLVLRGSPD